MRNDSIAVQPSSPTDISVAQNLTHVKSRAFVFCRPYLISDFEENLVPLKDEFEFKFMTDGRRPGTDDTRKRFYERLEVASPPSGFSHEDELDVVARCRYLRNLPCNQALKMLRSMALVLEEELNLFEPHVVVAQMVDEYITHLLSKIAAIRGLMYVGYIYSYFPGRAQIVLFSDGRPLKIREPSESEIIETWEQVSPRKFRQNYKQRNNYSKAQHLKSMLRYKVKQVAFRLLAWRDNDPLNLHYRCLPYVVERRHWRDFPTESEFHQNWRELLEKLPADKRKPVVYFPLAYFPESSTDYWVADKKILDYRNLTLNIFKSLRAEFTIIVKEHMHMLGGRSIDYYRAIMEIDGVISVPPAVNSNEVLLVSEAVILGGGSVGIEAFIRGKPILSFCNTSCWFSASGAIEIDLADIRHWPLKIREAIRTHRPPSEANQLQFIKRCLQGTMRVRKSGRFWPICDPNDFRQLLRMTASHPIPAIACPSPGAPALKKLGLSAWIPG